MEIQEPSVAIRCLVYNQEKYLRDCLDSIVMQQTSFPYFAVVHDDCSTDSSQKIIKEYANKYPEKIRPIFESHNCYSTDWEEADIKIQNAYGNAKYIAVCEGDDFWTSPYKLQKQVDFLERNQDYEVCAHETTIHTEDGRNVKFSDFCVNLLVSTKKNKYTFKETLSGNIFHLSSLMYRNRGPIIFPHWRYHISAGDMILTRYLGSLGKTYRFDQSMSVYRWHDGSLTHSEKEYSSQLKFNKLNIKVLRLLNIYWEKKYSRLIRPIVSRYYLNCMFIYLSKGNRNFSKAKEMRKLSLLYSPISYYKYFGIESIAKIKKHIHI